MGQAGERAGSLVYHTRLSQALPSKTDRFLTAMSHATMAPPVTYLHTNRVHAAATSGCLMSAGAATQQPTRGEL